MGVFLGVIDRRSCASECPWGLTKLMQGDPARADLNDPPRCQRAPCAKLLGQFDRSCVWRVLLDVSPGQRGALRALRPLGSSAFPLSTDAANFGAYRRS